MNKSKKKHTFRRVIATVSAFAILGVGAYHVGKRLASEDAKDETIKDSYFNDGHTVEYVMPTSADTNYIDTDSNDVYYAVATEDTYVRDAASENGTAMTKLLSGGGLVYVGMENNYYKVILNNQYAYISADSAELLTSDAYYESLNNLQATSVPVSTEEPVSTPEPVTFSSNYDVNQTYFVVSTDNVNVRTAPSADSTVVFCLHTGEGLKYVGETSDYYAGLYNNQTVYMNKSYAKVVTEQEYTASHTSTDSAITDYENYYVVATSDVNVRDAANLSSNVLFQLEYNDKLQYLGEEGNFYKASFDGQTVYVSKDYSKVQSVSKYEEEQEEMDRITHSSVVSSIPDDGTRNLGDLTDVQYVTATSDVNVRSAGDLGSDIYFVLKSGESLPLYEKINDDWYAVRYGNDVAYISTKYSKVTSGVGFPYEATGYAAVTKDVELFDDDVRTVATIPKNEVVTIYGTSNKYYLVEVNGYYGYIKKGNAKLLTGNFVVTDISDQTVTLFVDGKKYKTYSCVTGCVNKGYDTTEGIFQVLNITYNTVLESQKYGYKCPVDVFIRYNGGEGIHDAEYHNCENGSHGWRSAFGGDIYISGGSHGCTNTKNADAMEIADYMDVGDTVVVKH